MSRSAIVHPRSSLTTYSMLSAAAWRWAALGLKGTRTLQSRSRGGPIRGLNQEHRLQLLYQVTTAIEAVYSSAVAAAFLRGSDPQLEDRAPMLVIAQASRSPSGPWSWAR